MISALEKLHKKLRRARKIFDAACEKEIRPGDLIEYKRGNQTILAQVHSIRGDRLSMHGGGKAKHPFYGLDVYRVVRNVTRNRQ